MNSVANFEKIHEAWKRFEKQPREQIAKELKELQTDCEQCIKIFEGWPEKYTVSYNMYLKIAEKPILSSFFDEVQEISKDVYYFACEGHDLVNTSVYLECKDLNTIGIAERHYRYLRYTRYLEHVLLKILSEEDEAKKIFMLRGFLGC